jgi:hypothetical protein
MELISGLVSELVSVGADPSQVIGGQTDKSGALEYCLVR